MKPDVGKEVSAMRRMTVSQLKRKYETIFGEPCRSGNKPWLLRRIAWRLQANCQGDLSDRARARALELANDADLRLQAPKAEAPAEPQAGNDPRLPAAGNELSRTYKGRPVTVKILPQGFEYDGEFHRSLSAVAKAVTGAHWNGYYFFGIANSGRL